MCGPILVGFAALAAAELWVLIRVGAEVGAFQAVMLVFVTAAVGVHLARSQGSVVMSRIGAGVPARGDMLEGPLILFAGVCLLVPGFVTDAAGFALLLPPVRRGIAGRIARTIQRRHTGPGAARIIIFSPQLQPPDDDQHS